MPTFIEFLLAPWKILKFIGKSSPLVPNGVPKTSPLAATLPPETASQGLCSTKDLGGQLISVCNVGGYEMPSFIFWASLSIFLLFAVASTLLLKQCFKVTRTLNALANEISKVAPAQGIAALSTSELQSLSRLMRAQDLTALPWTRFEETLLSAPGTEEIYSTCSLETHMSRNALVEDNVNTALFNAIPGILTGVGLLMTFVAILDGLSNVSVSANMDVTGIGGLINGLSGKFVSSIVAVTCAVSFVFVERFAYAQPHRAWRNFMSRLAPRFKRRTAEHLLQRIEGYLHQQAQALGELKAKLES